MIGDLFAGSEFFTGGGGYSASSSASSGATVQGGKSGGISFGSFPFGGANGVNGLVLPIVAGLVVLGSVYLIARK